ncbi:hypothetical protein HU200_049928 [Digitaria exilis]|uniref:Uncharacterized protein n=1 Tax=Digitaria exilis TaxID=1010633 RepID=A0A835E828_9POAL|nr:hypothetical protein HU200_049928 [Digitaria exilis]
MTPPPGSSAAGTTTTAGLEELAFLDLSCSVDCLQCLTGAIGPCFADSILCPNLVSLIKCFAEKFVIINECFGTKP